MFDVSAIQDSELILLHMKLIKGNDRCIAEIIESILLGDRRVLVQQCV